MKTPHSSEFAENPKSDQKENVRVQESSGGQEVGRSQEQTQDELWEAEQRPEILLWQEYHTEDWRQKVNKLHFVTNWISE